MGTSVTVQHSWVTYCFGKMPLFFASVNVTSLYYSSTGCRKIFWAVFVQCNLGVLNGPVCQASFLQNFSKYLWEFPVIYTSQTSATVGALLCATTTVRSPRPLSLPLRSLPSTERPRLTLWLGGTQTHLSPPGRAAGATRSDSPLCLRSEAFNPVQMECMAFKATKRNDGREAGREWLVQLTRWTRALASRRTCFSWLFWGRPLCSGCGVMSRSISQRWGGWRGGTVSHWTLSHFRLRDCQRDAFLDISEQPAGLKSVRVLLRAPRFSVCVWPPLSHTHRFSILLCFFCPSGDDVSILKHLWLFGSFFLFKMPFICSIRELPPLNTAEGKQSARQRWWSLQTSRFIRPVAHHSRRGWGGSCCVCVRGKRRRRMGDGSSTAQGARHEDRCSEVIILLSFTTAKLGLTLTDASGPMKWHGRTAAETQTPKCQAVPLRLVCLLISFLSPLAVTSLSYAWPHERVPARCHVSTVTAEWILGNGHRTEKNSVYVRAPSWVSSCYSLFFSQFHCCDSLSKLFCVYFSLFCDLWHTVDHQCRSCHCPSTQMWKRRPTKFPFIAFLTFNFCVSKCHDWATRPHLGRDF